MRSPLKLSSGMGADKRAAKQRRARPLPLHSLRTYPSPSPQISIYFFKPVNVFSMCVCERTRASSCASLLSSVKSNRVIYTRGKSGPSALPDTFCLFPCQYHQYGRWQRARRDMALRGQTPVSLPHTRDASLRSRWMRENQSTGKTLASRRVYVHFSTRLVLNVEREK